MKRVLFTVAASILVFTSCAANATASATTPRSLILPAGGVLRKSASYVSTQKALLTCDLYVNKIENNQFKFGPPVASSVGTPFTVGAISPVLLSVTFPEPFQDYQVDFWQFIVGFGETHFQEVPYLQGLFSKSGSALPDFRDALFDIGSATPNSKVTLRGTATISDTEFLSFLCSIQFLAP